MKENEWLGDEQIIITLMTIKTDKVGRPESLQHSGFLELEMRSVTF